MLLINDWISAVLVAKLALLTTTLVLISSTSVMICNPFSLIVVPVSTISTIQSAISIMGANSTLPFNLMVVAWTPCFVKNCLATAGYLDATFKEVPFVKSKSFMLATTNLHFPSCKSSNSYISAFASKLLSRATISISAATSSTYVANSIDCTY